LQCVATYKYHRGRGLCSSSKQHAWTALERKQALADHSHGGVVGLVFGAFGECSQSVDLLVESFGKLIGEQGFAEMGYRKPEVGVGVATWAIRREWAMTHWRESANLMWRNLEHVTGTYSKHAKTKP
jgi:hypothetical protein